MILREHNVKEKISRKEFKSKIEKVPENNIITTKHTFFRLSEKQRKIYDEKLLKEFILKKEPIEIWKQMNDNLAIIYKFRENNHLKIIVNLAPKKVYIVTFYILNRKQEQEWKNG